MTGNSTKFIKKLKKFRQKPLTTQIIRGPSKREKKLSSISEFCTRRITYSKMKIKPETQENVPKTQANVPKRLRQLKFLA